MKTLLRTFAIITVLAAATYGACHASQTRKMQSFDGPHCLPGQVCPVR